MTGSDYERIESILERIAVACESLAEHFVPSPQQERKPAILGTAAYSEEERERLRLKAEFKKKAAPPRGRA